MVHGKILDGGIHNLVDRNHSTTGVCQASMATGDVVHSLDNAFVNCHVILMLILPEESSGLIQGEIEVGGTEKSVLGERRRILRVHKGGVVRSEAHHCAVSWQGGGSVPHPTKTSSAELLHLWGVVAVSNSSKKSPRRSLDEIGRTENQASA